MSWDSIHALRTSFGPKGEVELATTFTCSADVSKDWIWTPLDKDLLNDTIGIQAEHTELVIRIMDDNVRAYMLREPDNKYLVKVFARSDATKGAEVTSPETELKSNMEKLFPSLVDKFPGVVIPDLVPEAIPVPTPQTPTAPPPITAPASAGSNTRIEYRPSIDGPPSPVALDELKTKISDLSTKDETITFVPTGKDVAYIVQRDADVYMLSQVSKHSYNEIVQKLSTEMPDLADALKQSVSNRELAASLDQDVPAPVVQPLPEPMTPPSTEQGVSNRELAASLDQDVPAPVVQSLPVPQIPEPMTPPSTEQSALNVAPSSRKLAFAPPPPVPRKAGSFRKKKRNSGKTYRRRAPKTDL
jgi:hypothetical protein